MDELVTIDVDGFVATVTLNRPGRLNAFDEPTVEALRRALLRVAPDRQVRAVVIRGAGRAFCAGGDLRAALEAEPERPGNAFYRLAGVFHQCVTEIRTMPKPVVAAIHGAAAGGGFSLALACDMRVMEQSAFLQQAYTSNGLVIDGGGTFTLPRLVGLAKALEIAFLDERISADRALSLGLATEVVPDGEATKRAQELAATLTQRAVFALARVKRLMNRSFDRGLEGQLEDERLNLSETASSPEGIEGLRAFVEKRKPRFTDLD